MPGLKSLSEPTPIQDTMAHGVVPILRPGQDVRLFFWAFHPLVGQGELTPEERVIVAKLVMTPQNYEAAMRELRRPTMLAS